MSEETSQQKWNVERVHKEIQEARNKLFVVNKVVETGSIQFDGHEEWVLVIKPLIRDILQFSQQLETGMNLPEEKKRS
jgi:hypothetical protein